jgi:hypothetical protein
MKCSPIQSTSILSFCELQIDFSTAINGSRPELRGCVDGFLIWFPGGCTLTVETRHCRSLINPPNQFATLNPPTIKSRRVSSLRMPQ